MQYRIGLGFIVNNAFFLPAEPSLVSHKMFNVIPSP